MVHSFLVSADQALFVLETWVPVVLRLVEDVPSHGRGRRFSIGVVRNNGVLSQVGVKSPFKVSRLVNSAEATRIHRDVSVSASAIVRILHWFGMDGRQRMGWSLLGRHE